MTLCPRERSRLCGPVKSSLTVNRRAEKARAAAAPALVAPLRRHTRGIQPVSSTIDFFIRNTTSICASVQSRHPGAAVHISQSSHEQGVKFQGRQTPAGGMLALGEMLTLPRGRHFPLRRCLLFDMDASGQKPSQSLCAGSSAETRKPRRADHPAGPELLRPIRSRRRLPHRLWGRCR